MYLQQPGSLSINSRPYFGIVFYHRIAIASETFCPFHVIPSPILQLDLSYCLNSGFNEWRVLTRLRSHSQIDCCNKSSFSEMNIVKEQVLGAIFMLVAISVTNGVILSWITYHKNHVQHCIHKTVFVSLVQFPRHTEIELEGLRSKIFNPTL